MTSLLVYVLFTVLLAIAIAKRKAPAIIDNIVHKGVEYSTQFRDWSCFVYAHSVRNHQLLWETKLYSIAVIPEMETDVQEVHLKFMKLSDNQRYLILEDELQRTFRVHTKTGHILST